MLYGANDNRLMAVEVILHLPYKQSCDDSVISVNSYA